jgi:hypothetical protein
MSRTSRNARATAITVIMMLLLGGCASSLRQQAYHLHQKAAFKVGDRWIIKPPRQIKATRIELSREHRAGSAAPTLVIDLTNGRGAYRDVDGRTYPHQFNEQTVQRLGAYMTDRSWQVNTIRADSEADAANTYHLTVYEGDQKVKPDQITWAVPPSRALPDSLALLVDTFNEAYRAAHPLSNDVDMLRY